MDKLPPRGGILLQAKHAEQLIDEASVSWLCIRPEDYLALGGKSTRQLEAIQQQYSLSMHAVGLSIGSAESVNDTHLQNIKSLSERYSPVNITTPLSWCRWQGRFYGTNLPVPYTEETLDQTTFNLHTIQNTLGRRILVCNNAQYLPFAEEQIPEGAFFEQLVRNSGCGMALDLTHLYASALNAGVDPFKQLTEFPLATVKEIHLSGQDLLPLNDDTVLTIADQPTAISKPVWQLFRELLNLLPRPIATLIKWPSQHADLQALIEEVRMADDIIDEKSKHGQNEGGLR